MTPPSSSPPSQLAPIPQGPRPARRCGWLRGALRCERPLDALQRWEAEGLVRLDPAEAVTLALLEAEAGRWDRARALAGEALAATPENPLAAGVAGIADYQLGDLRGAGRHLNRHGLFAAFPLVRLFVWTFAEPLRLHPERFPAETGDSLNAQEPRVSALEALVFGGGLGPAARARALTRRGDREFLRGRLAHAERAYEAAARACPEEETAALAHALLQIERGERLAPTRRLTALLASQPDSPALTAAAAYGWYHLGEFRRALALLATLTPAGPDDWGAYYLGALCLRALGENARAGAALEVALGPFFLDTWELFIQPMFRRALASLALAAETPRESIAAESGL